MDYSPWSPKESDTTERLSTQPISLYMDLCLGLAQFPGIQFTWPPVGQAWVSPGNTDELAVVGQGAAPGPLCSPRGS